MAVTSADRLVADEVVWCALERAYGSPSSILWRGGVDDPGDAEAVGEHAVERGEGRWCEGG
jgi:hypothetical protein